MKWKERKKVKREIMKIEPEERESEGEEMMNRRGERDEIKRGEKRGREREKRGGRTGRRDERE